MTQTEIQLAKSLNDLKRQLYNAKQSLRFHRHQNEMYRRWIYNLAVKRKIASGEMPKDSPMFVIDWMVTFSESKYARMAAKDKSRISSPSEVLHATRPKGIIDEYDGGKFTPLFKQDKRDSWLSGKPVGAT